jgi:hypothetical protein
MTTNEIIGLMGLGITNDKLITFFDKLNIEQPQITEQYEIDRDITILDSDNSGLNFVFEEIDGLSTDGEPCLVQIDFTNFEKQVFPYELTTNDDYQVCCNKIGKRADFNHKRIKDCKIWIIESTYTKCQLIIHFADSNFTNIKSVVIVTFDESDKKRLIPNEE